jgi:hypothetical protein
MTRRSVATAIAILVTVDGAIKYVGTAMDVTWKK